MRTIEGVSGALIVGGKVLVVRRSANDGFLPGYYELPGGKIELGESHETAITREFMEEVSLRVRPLHLYNKFSYQPGPNTKATDYEYLVELAEDENIASLQLSEEHDDYKWVSSIDLNALDPITPEKSHSLKIALAS
jgi:8-oxo-dGTP diphosphatase